MQYRTAIALEEFGRRLGREVGNPRVAFPFLSGFYRIPT